jgi:lipopolysaccharide biosynthesis glycosyltransferase
LSERIQVVLGVDHRCVRGCAVSIRSVMDNASASVALDFHIITNGIADRDRHALERTVVEAGRGATVAFHAFDPSEVAHFLRSKLITHTAYAVLYLGDLLPPSVTRCIYLDSDLAFERDIVELWRTDLEGRSLGAADNRFWQDSAYHQGRLGLREARYFNSGVLLIDLARWRERAVGARALAFAERMGDRLIMHDQDALNHALEDDWVDIAPHWNLWVIHVGLRAEDRAVFHYMGGPKPWHADYDRRFQDKFFHYLDRTPFEGWRPWNPAGLGARLARLKRRAPYLPSAFRALRRRLSLAPDQT